MRTHRWMGLLGGLVIACVACSDDGASGSENEGVSSTDETETEAEAETETETEAETETENSTDGPDTTGGSLCDEACQVITECGSEGEPLESCVEECDYLLEALAADAPECVAVHEDLYGCITELSCEEWQAFVAQESPYACETEYEAMGECADPGCALQASATMDNSACDVLYDCGDGVYTVHCMDGDGCTCAIDGEAVASCSEIAPVCGPLEAREGEPSPWFDEEALEAGIESCCGWVLDL